MIIDHLARIGADGAIRDADVDQLCAMAKHKKVMLKVGAFYALGKKEPPYDDLAPLIKRAVTAFGPKRCMWESDCPFQVQDEHTYKASVDLVLRRLDFLSAEERSGCCARRRKGCSSGSRAATRGGGPGHVLPQRASGHIDRSGLDVQAGPR